MRHRKPATAAAVAVLLALAGCSADARPTAAHHRGHHGGQHGGQHGDRDGDHHGTGHHRGHGSSDAGDDGSSDGGTTTVAVYWVGDSPQGPRLFREFRKVPAGDPYAEAVHLLASGEPLDPDYRSLVTGLDVRSVDHTGSTYALTLGDDAPTEPPSGMTAAQTRLAVQQLVYTVQAVGQSRDPVDVDHLYGEAGLVTNADFSRTLNLASVTSPEQGATVGDRFTASGVASSFEANVVWEVRQGDRVVERGSTTAEGWTDKLYPWETTVDVSGLAPGDYTFVAMTDDPSGGQGRGPQWDSKDITVS